MPDSDLTPDVAALTVRLLSAYLANNTVPSQDLAELIRTTKAALTQEPSAAVESEKPERFTPAVSVRKSLASPKHIISLIDGKPYKTLKRHLASRGLTPDEYRSRYNLPASYPMVAPDYADQRRAVAHRLGLGRKGPKADAGGEQEASAPIAAADVQSAATASAATAMPASNRKASPKGSPRGRKKTTVENLDSVSEPDADPAPFANVDDASPEGRSDMASQLSAASALQTVKRAPSDKRQSPESRQPGAKASAPVEPAAPETATEAGDSDALPAKPSKQRHKIGLFKKVRSETISSTPGADQPRSEMTPEINGSTASDVVPPSTAKS